MNLWTVLDDPSRVAVMAALAGEDRRARNGVSVRGRHGVDVDEDTRVVGAVRAGEADSLAGQGAGAADNVDLGTFHLAIVLDSPGLREKKGKGRERGLRRAEHRWENQQRGGQSSQHGGGTGPRGCRTGCHCLVARVS